jgi:hypothetical protein
MIPTDTFLDREFFELEKDTMVERVTQDVEPILEANKWDANHASNYTQERDMKHVARIPLVVAEDWMNKFGVDVLNPDHRDKVRALLNDPDYRWLRTGSGQL